ncbi:MAG: helix-turn-helix domain-containing protein [Rhodothermales bacterium]|nr:helix-turn-helix domain-containing protein [Rhodothermales bacterium]
MQQPAPLHLIEDPDAAAAVMNPLRRTILEALRTPDSAAGVARRLDISRQKLGYHMRKLEADGLIEKVGERQARGFTEVLMRTVAQSFLVSPKALGSIEADPKDVKDKASSAYLIAAAGRLIRNVGELRRAADDEGKRLATLTAESSVTFASADEQRAFGEELTRAIAALVLKYHTPDAADGRTFDVFTAVSQRPTGRAAGQSSERASS